MDDNGQEDLTPAQLHELAVYLARFFDSLKSDPAAQEAFRLHPGRELGKYRRRMLKQRHSEEPPC